jgi:hypothetical protein
MMDNYAESTKLATEATNANGLANAKNDVFITSINSRLQVLSSTMSMMWQNMISSSVIKGAVDGLITLATTFGNLTSIITTTGVALLWFKGTAIKGAIVGVYNYITAMASLAVMNGVVGTSTIAVSSAFAKLNAILIKHPLGLLAIAIATVVGGLMIYKNRVKEVAKANEELFETSKNLTKQYSEMSGLLEKAEALEKEANNTSNVEKSTQARAELLEVQKQMASVLPNTTSSYSAEGDAIAGNNTIIREQLELKRQELILNSQKFMDENKGLDDLSTKYAQAKKDVEDLKIAQAQGKKTVTQDVEVLDRNGIKRTSQIEVDVAKALAEKNKFMQESISTISKYNIYADILNKNTGSSIKYIHLESDAFSKNTKNINDNRSAKEVLDSTLKSQIKSEEMLNDEFDTSTQKMEFYNKVLSELNEKHKLSTSSVKEVLKNYPELKNNLTSEADLRKQVTSLIGKEADVQRNAYADMLVGSENFYNEKIKGTKVLQDNLGDFYTKDLENVKSLAEAKFLVDSKLIEELSKKWGEYYSIASNSVNVGAFIAEDGSADGSFANSKGRIALTGAINKDISDTKKRLDEVAEKFRSISTGGKKVSFDTVNLSGVKEGSKDKDPKTSTSEALTTNPFDIILNKQNKSLELQNNLIDTTKSNIKQLLDIGSSNSYSKALESQNNLYDQQVNKINLLKENIASVSGKNGINGLENALKSNYSALKNSDISKMSEDDLKSLATKLFPTKTFVGDNADKDSKKYEAGRQTFLDYVDNLQKMREAKETYNKDILTSEIELSNIVKETYEQTFANNDRLLSKYEDDVKSATDSISLLGSIDSPEEEQSQLNFINQRKSARVNELSAVNSEMDKLNEELKTISTTTNEGQLRIKSINDRLKELSDRQIDVKINIIADEDSIKSTIKSQVQSLIEAERKIAEQSLENDKLVKFDKYDKDLEAFKKLQQDKIDLIDLELDKLDKTNQAEDERAERIKRQNDLIEIQTQLTNVKNEKNIKAFTGEKFEWVADQAKIDELTKQANEKKEDNNKWENDLATKHLKEQKEIEKKAYQDSISAKEKYYTDLKESDNKYYSNEKFLLDQHYLNMDTLVATYMDTLKLTYESKWDIILTMLDVKLTEATTKQNALLAISNGLQNNVNNLGMSPQTVTNLSALNNPNNASKIEQAKDSNPTSFFDLANKINLTTGAEQAKAIAEMKKLTGLATGGMTKNWSDGDSTNGKVVKLHPNEIVNNPIDSSLLLKTMEISKNIMMNLIPKINRPDFSKFNLATAGNGNTENHYSFGDLSFPNMRDGDGISTFINELDNIKFIKPRK